MRNTTNRDIRYRRPGNQSRGPEQRGYDAADYTFSSVYRLLEKLDSAVSLSVAIQLRNGEWGDLVKRGLNSTLDPLDYLTADSFRIDYLATCVLQKVEFITIPGVDKKEVALTKWKDCERACSATNTRLEREGSMPEPVWLAIQQAKRKISRLLGKFRWEEAHALAGFGKGGTTRVPRREANAANKTWGLLHVGSHYLDRASHSFREVIHLNQSAVAPQKEGAPNAGIVPVDWNKVTTVPKSAKTDRPIASEPDCNIWIQKGIGSCISRRLRSVGIDLNSQVNNQIMAQKGSETGMWATVDLSSASDTISKKLVEMLLPDDWLEALAVTRSPYGLMDDGTKVLYRKWSSMGNGYTFELETLIFWALASSVMEQIEAPSHQVIVYGDDIIIPSEGYGPLVDVFTYCGFTINQDKSFHTGPFRESCGKHYFNGEDVTPFYLKKRLDGPHRWFWWVNRIRYWTRREVAGFHFCDVKFKSIYEEARQFFGALPDPKGWALSTYTVPSGIAEDSGFVSNFDESNACTLRRAPKDLRVPYVQALTFRMLNHVRVIKTQPSHPGNLAAWLFLRDEPDGAAAPRGALNDHHNDDEPLVVNSVLTDAWLFKRKQGSCWTWCDIGPWL